MVFKKPRPGPVPALAALFALTLTLASLNCPAQGKAIRFEKRDLSIERSGAGSQAAPVRVEIARTNEEREQGLMNRKELPDGEGMIFVFEKDQILRFWMKNTLIPLSIAFIAADGAILEIRRMEPGSLATVSSSRSARYALEVPLGWFDRAGIGVGDRVQLGPILP